MASQNRSLIVLLVLLGILLLSTPAHAFGAGNIASISKIEGKNFRHGDIEDALKALAFLKGGKWTSKQIKRVYFGNWLRDYSQALDVGTLKGVPPATIRVLVAILAFLSFGYATEEYEVTDQRLGVYRPEEHIDNPKNYADNLDARAYDPRLRPPVQQIELEVDLQTGMKNYIANEQGGWATSIGYVKYSLDRSIHFGRLYTSGQSGLRGKKEDLSEALRCLGQALHTLEDFSAHSNYCELVLRELGIDAFPHVGSSTQIYLAGKQVFPLVTGTFGSTDFLLSVLGEAQDHLTQNELEELDLAMAEAEDDNKKRTSGSRGFGSSGGGSSDSEILKTLLTQIPGGGGLGEECSRLQADSDAQAFANMNISGSRAMGPGGGPGGGMGGAISAYNPDDLIRRVWPILQFRDRVFRSIEAAIEQVPGLVDIVEKISELLSVFIFSLLAPILRPVIEQVALELKTGSNGVLSASESHQFEPWTDPRCSDPTHSLLAKDHFSNRLNGVCGMIAQAVVSYVVPRVVFAWENPNTPVQMVLDDVTRVFHHPAARDQRLEIHTNMFKTVQDWLNARPDRGHSLNFQLNAEGVRTGKNHTDGMVGGSQEGGHGKVKGSDLSKAENRVKKKKKGDQSTSLDPFAAIAGAIGGQSLQGIISNLTGSGGGGSGSTTSDYYGNKPKKDKYKDKERGYDDYDYGKTEKDRVKDYEKSEKHKSKEHKSKVKDEDYYRRKEERKARKAAKHGEREERRKHRHKTREIGDDDDDDDDDDSEDDTEEEEEKYKKSHKKSHSSSSKHKDRGYEGYGSSRAPPEEHEARRSYEQPAYEDPYRQGYGGYTAPAAEGHFGGYPRDPYDAPPQSTGGYDYSAPPAQYGHSGHNAPYPSGNAEPYSVPGGYMINPDGNVGRERDYDYGGYVGSRDISYPDETQYGAPPPSQDFGYVSGGYGNYSGGGEHGHDHSYGY